MFHGEYAKSLFDQSVLENIGKSLEYEANYFYPEATKFGDKPIDLPEERIILFNHRLNNSTGWKEVVEGCSLLHECGYEFKLWLTDEQNLKEKEYLSQFPFIINKRVPFESYGYLMRNSCFSVCNTQGYATWNMAVQDSILNGCLPVVPYNEMYRKMLGEHGIYFNKDHVLGWIYWHLTSREEWNKGWLDKLKVHVDDFNLEHYILGEITNRVKSTPSKYEEVVKYIKSKGSVSKKDFVNEFWDFHANSNFQIIRWKLLLDGFIDDTSQHETKYSSSFSKTKRINE